MDSHQSLVFVCLFLFFPLILSVSQIGSESYNGEWTEGSPEKYNDLSQERNLIIGITCGI